MSEITRQAIFAQAAQKLRHDFGELSTVPHNALKGHEAEKLVRKFLTDHLPKRFSVGSGFIIDPLDKISKQTDVVIYDAFNCPVYRVSEDAAIFPSDNVAAVVEVKARLNKEKLREAFENIVAAKSLAKTKPPDLPMLIQTQTLGCLFAFESSITLDKVSEHYAELIREFGIGQHIDIIVVLDRGLITLSGKISDDLGWNVAIVEAMGGPHAEGSHIAVAVNELGADSLDGFLRLLLAQLTYFRGLVDHPGFNWQKTESKGQIKLTYLTSITMEQDPELKRKKLQEYAETVREEFSKNPIPPNVG